MCFRKVHVNVDTALGSVAVVFKFQAVMVLIRRIIGRCQRGKSQSRALEVDEGLQCCSRLGRLDQRYVSQNFVAMQTTGTIDIS